jgi:hypothetical protein
MMPLLLFSGHYAPRFDLATLFAENRPKSPNNAA